MENKSYLSQEHVNFTKEIQDKSHSIYKKKFEKLNSQEEAEVVKESLNEFKAQHFENNHVKKEEISDSLRQIRKEQIEKTEEIILKLSPDDDDNKMEELLGVVQSEGILNTIKAIENTESFHIMDDFHKVIIQYIREGYKPEKLNPKNILFKYLKRKLFKIQVLSKKEDESSSFSEELSKMEQFYSGMISVANSIEKEFFSLEIVNSGGQDSVSFYCSIPESKEQIFKTQLLSILPNAILTEIYDDYNIFHKGNRTIISIASLVKKDFLPIKTYKNFEYNPLNILIKSISSIPKDNGVSLQIMLKQPYPNEYSKKADTFLKKLSSHKGRLEDLVSKKKTNPLKAVFSVVDFFVSGFASGTDKTDISSDSNSEERNGYVQKIQEKKSKQTYGVNIRIVVSSKTTGEALNILNQIEACFYQFEDTNSNNFSFKRLKNKKKVKTSIFNFIYRAWNEKFKLFLNTEELSSLFNLSENLIISDSLDSAKNASSFAGSNFKKIKDKSSSMEKNKFTLNKKVNNTEEIKEIQEETNKTPPIKEEIGEAKILTEQESPSSNNFSYSLKSDGDTEENNTTTLAKEDSPTLPQKENEEKVPHISKTKELEKEEEKSEIKIKKNEDIILGINEHQGVQSEIKMQEKDRFRHMYVIGQTGTGKTGYLKTSIMQDIENGSGLCFIDPHGSDIEDILKNIPKNRHKDVIYFDPGDTSKPLGLNMLEYDVNKPEQKTLVVNEMLSIFDKLFDMKAAGGAIFEQYFRNAVLLTIEDPSTGSTLLDVTRVFTDKDFRELKIKNSKNILVNEFWNKIALQAGGESSLENITPYIVSKFDNFLSNDIMRLIVTQQKSSLNFREIMDTNKILLVNLSKGKLGEINSNLIGLILVGKILIAALSRVDKDPKTLENFFLYIDEFQNITTNSISQILSEARKYKLSLTLAHQYISQIPEETKNAIFGNVGSMAVFRVSQEDSKFLESQFKPTFSAEDIMSLSNRHAYLKMLVNGEPSKPFNIKTIDYKEGDPENSKLIKKLSSEKYGKDRALVEEEINNKFSSI